MLRELSYLIDKSTSYVISAWKIKRKQRGKPFKWSTEDDINNIEGTG
jgi:hypothetical protein